MRLDIYEKKTIVKTYEADTYDLEFGILEDVADVVKIDDIETGSDAEILKMAAKAVIGMATGLLVDAVKHGIVHLPGKACLASVGQMAAVVQAHAQHSITGIQQGEINGHVGLAAAVGLHVHVVVGVENLFPLLAAEILSLCDVLILKGSLHVLDKLGDVAFAFSFANGEPTLN